METDQLREVTVADSLESSGLDLTDSLSWYQWRINNETQKMKLDAFQIGNTHTGAAYLEKRTFTTSILC